MYNKFSHTAIKLGQITAKTGLCHRRGTAHNHGHHLLQSSPANCRDKDMRTNRITESIHKQLQLVGKPVST